jgi:hypothetical protein
MSLPGTKALYVGEIISGRITFSLAANILEIILYTTLQSEIGQNCVTSSGFSTLGIKTTIVSF